MRAVPLNNAKDDSGRGGGRIPHCHERYNVCLQWCRDTLVVFVKGWQFLLVSLGEGLGSGSVGWWGWVFLWKKGKGGGGGRVGGWYQPYAVMRSPSAHTCICVSVHTIAFTGPSTQIHCRISRRKGPLIE